MEHFQGQALWEHLQTTQKKIFLYGMGNGAEKILAACASRGIPVEGIFASDGFVRGHSFRSMPVRSYSETKALYGADNMLVLLAFGTSREEVLDTILRVADECELYAPDVPVFGEGLFDRAFFEAHREELDAARGLLSDGRSREIFDRVIAYKLSGRIEPLLGAVSDEREDMETLIRPTWVRFYADFGAYNGDTAAEMIEASEGNLEAVYAFEPDGRNYKKLSAMAEHETRARIYSHPVAAWSERATLYFDASGNRNASMGENRSHILSGMQVKQKSVEADAPDVYLADKRIDYAKYDVEGSEREALLGSTAFIAASYPTLRVSLYHRNEDLFALPLLIKELFPQYNRYYIRRRKGIPAWDLDLIVRREI